MGFGVWLVVHTHTDLKTIITRVKQVRNLHVLTSTDWPNDAKALRRELSIGKCWEWKWLSIEHLVLRLYWELWQKEPKWQRRSKLGWIIRLDLPRLSLYRLSVWQNLPTVEFINVETWVVPFWPSKELATIDSNCLNPAYSKLWENRWLLE